MSGPQMPCGPATEFSTPRLREDTIGQGHAVLVVKANTGDLVHDVATHKNELRNQSGPRLISMPGANPFLVV